MRGATRVIGVLREPEVVYHCDTGVSLLGACANLRWFVLSGTQLPPPWVSLKSRGHLMIGQPLQPFVPTGGGYSLH